MTRKNFAFCAKSYNEDGKPGMPFFMETDGDRVYRIFEKPMA